MRTIRIIEQISLDGVIQAPRRAATLTGRRPDGPTTTTPYCTIASLPVIFSVPASMR